MTGEKAMTRADVRKEAARIAREAGARVLLDERLAPYLSMRVGGEVPAFIEPADSDMLAAVVRALHLARVPFRLLGGGSNLVAEEAGLDFAVVHVPSASARAAWDGAVVRAPAGMQLAALLRDATQRGRTGLEWAAGLPGTIGGAVFGNAGAHGGEIGASVVSVSLMTPDGIVREHPVVPGDFRYRRSFMRPGEVILDVTLEMATGDPSAIRAETDRVNRTRAASQPKGGHSSGCIFRNPEGDAAGRLVDACGLKGRRRGGAVVSEAHGNFIVNDGSATADDILGLIEDIRAAVKAQSGVELDLEIVVWRGAP